jgi:hypothetical protein
MPDAHDILLFQECPEAGAFCAFVIRNPDLYRLFRGESFEKFDACVLD